MKQVSGALGSSFLENYRQVAPAQIDISKAYFEVKLSIDVLRGKRKRPEQEDGDECEQESSRDLNPSFFKYHKNENLEEPVYAPLKKIELKKLEEVEEVKVSSIKKFIPASVRNK